MASHHRTVSSTGAGIETGSPGRGRVDLGVTDFSKAIARCFVGAAQAAMNY
jgi:hypothetical protein